MGNLGTRFPESIFACIKFWGLTTAAAVRICFFAVSLFYLEIVYFVSDLRGQNYGPDLFLQTNDFLQAFCVVEISLNENFGTCPFVLSKTLRGEMKIKMGFPIMAQPYYFVVFGFLDLPQSFRLSF